MTDQPSSPAGENGKADEPGGRSQPDAEDSGDLAEPPLSQIEKVGTESGDGPNNGSLSASEPEVLEDPARLREL